MFINSQDRIDDKKMVMTWGTFNHACLTCIHLHTLSNALSILRDFLAAVKKSTTVYSLEVTLFTSPWKFSSLSSSAQVMEFPKL